MQLKKLNISNLFMVLLGFAAWWITAKAIEPFLHYHFQHIGFDTTLAFFKSYTTYPGGIADYAAEFIAQFFSINDFGILLIVLVASLQGLIALDLVTRLRGKT